MIACFVTAGTAVVAIGAFLLRDATASLPTSPAVDSPRIQDNNLQQAAQIAICPSSPVVRVQHEAAVLGFAQSISGTCSSPSMRGQHDISILGPGYSTPQLGIGMKRRFEPDENVSNFIVTQASTQRRKESHNATEQKRRQKINDKMNELRQLLPNCREHSVDKATILNEAIELIRKYFADAEAWQGKEMELKRINQELAEENESLARAAGLEKKEKLVE